MRGPRSNKYNLVSQMIRDKIKDRQEITRAAEGLRADKKKIVFTNGCFDILHCGHVTYLEYARSLGDALIVGVNGDRSVRRIKGDGRPYTDERARMTVIAALGSVDLVTSFDEDDPYELIRQVVPDVLVKGGDWKESDVIGGDVVRQNGGRVVIAPFVNGYSSSDVISKVRLRGKEKQQ